MAELIQRTDDLNTGREKLNNAILDAEDAKQKSDHAVNVSEQAKQIAQTAENKADNVQEQFNQVVIEGDSSVEAAQARVDADGNTFTTLKERLDTKDTQFASQLAHKPNKEEVRDKASQLKVEGGLYIDTFDGSYQPYHPSVVHFTELFNGFSFWMAYTPYPIGGGLYIDRWECPSIAVSNDGVTWTTPPGLTNPIQDLTEEQIQNRAYYSDPCLIYHNNQFELWYRLTEDRSNVQGTKVYRVFSSDGINWSEPELVLTGDDPNNGLSGNDRIFRSMQVFVIDGVYRVYYVTQDLGLKFAESSNPASGFWENETVLNLINDHGESIWHIGMYKEDNLYHLTAYVSTLGICYYTSLNGVDFTYHGTIIKNNDVKYSGIKGLYQTVPVKVGDEWYVFASYEGEKKSFPRGRFHNITLFTGHDLMNLYPVDTGKKDSHQYINGDILLMSNRGTNYYANQRNHLLFYKSPDGGEKYGIGFNKDSKTLEFLYNRKYYPISTQEIANNDPYRLNAIPKYAGELFIDTNKKLLFFGTGTGSNRDFQLVQNNNKVSMAADTVVTINGEKILVLNDIINKSVERIDGAIEGQEIVIINANVSDITLVNGVGNMRLNGGVNKVLKRYDATRMIYTNGFWYNA